MRLSIRGGFLRVKRILDIVLPGRKGEWPVDTAALCYIDEWIRGIDNGIAASDYLDKPVLVIFPLKKTKNKKAVEEISTTARKILSCNQ